MVGWTLLRAVLTWRRYFLIGLATLVIFRGAAGGSAVGSAVFWNLQAPRQMLQKLQIIMTDQPTNKQMLILMDLRSNNKRTLAFRCLQRSYIHIMLSMTTRHYIFTQARTRLHLSVDVYYYVSLAYTYMYVCKRKLAWTFILDVEKQANNDGCW